MHTSDLFSLSLSLTSLVPQHLFEVKRKCLEKELQARATARKTDGKQDHLVLRETD